jgi:hypothetical protein
LYQQKEGKEMVNSQSPVVSNVFMEHFEEIALDTGNHKAAKWLRYFEDTFVVWPHGPARLQLCFQHLSSVRPTVKLTIEVEVNYTLSFSDILVMKRGAKLAGNRPFSALQVQPPTSREKGILS